MRPMLRHGGLAYGHRKGAQGAGLWGGEGSGHGGPEGGGGVERLGGEGEKHGAV